MAKNGTLSGTGDAGILEKVAPSSPASGTLGEIAEGLAIALAVAAVLVVDFGRRTVGVYEQSAPLSAAIDGTPDDLGAAGDDGRLFFSFADFTKNSSEILVENADSADILVPLGAAPAAASATAVNAYLSEALSPSKPTKSLRTLINLIEDALSAGTTEGVLFIDQAEKRVMLGIVPDTSAVQDFTATVGAAPGTVFACEARIAQTVSADDSTGSGPFNL